MIDAMTTQDVPPPSRREPLAPSPTPISLPAPSSVPHLSPTGIIKDDKNSAWHWLRRKRKRRNT
jgi:hypothetical protein